MGQQAVPQKALYRLISRPANRLISGPGASSSRKKYKKSIFFGPPTSGVMHGTVLPLDFLPETSCWQLAAPLFYPLRWQDHAKMPPASFGGGVGLGEKGGGFGAATWTLDEQQQQPRKKHIHR